jgi:hypothetical protein
MRFTAAARQVTKAARSRKGSSTAMNNKPTYDAFTVRNHKGKTYWTRLGVVFISEKGGRVLMDGLPTQNPEGQYELVLLPYKPTDEA